MNACSAFRCVMWSDKGYAKWDHAMSAARGTVLGRTRSSPWMLKMAAKETISETHPYLTAADRAPYQIGSTGSFAASLPASVRANLSIRPLQTLLSQVFDNGVNDLTYMSFRSSLARKRTSTDGGSTKGKRSTSSYRISCSLSTTASILEWTIAGTGERMVWRL